MKHFNNFWKADLPTKWCRGEMNSVFITFRNPLDAPLAIKECYYISSCLLSSMLGAKGDVELKF